MGKQSTRENKNIYQLCREEQGLASEKASEKLDDISLAIDSLNLWVDKTASENNLNIMMLGGKLLSYVMFSPVALWIIS